MIYPFSEFQYKDEEACVEGLLSALDWPEARAEAIMAHAVSLVKKTRNAKGRGGQLEAFLQEFSLNTDEGLAMMCLAEALLRVPDAATANALIRDRVVAANWLQKQGEGSRDWMTRAAGMGMVLTRKTLEGSLARLGEPLIREAMIRAMQMMGRQFVIGESIEKALDHAKAQEARGCLMSYDILGEGARDAETAQRYFDAYSAAIHAIGKMGKGHAAGLSVKLSALHPRYTYAQKDVCVPVLVERLCALAQMAARYNMPLTVDAEEAARLDLSIGIIETVFKDDSLRDWDGFGLAVQAYQKRALPLLDYLGDMAQAQKKRLQVRVVKGAYWDSEIKGAQMGGYPDYPVFTRKQNTDLSWLACAARLLDNPVAFYPMFATHNAHSIAAVHNMAREKGVSFEFQRLHGMGETLYAHVIDENLGNVRVYAPVGPHRDLLPYLVRRLLENGANSSFVNQILDKTKPAVNIVHDPVMKAETTSSVRHPKIPLPVKIFGEARENSKGLDLNDPLQSSETLRFIKTYTMNSRPYSLISGEKIEEVESYPSYIDQAFEAAQKALPAWRDIYVQGRAKIIESFADLLELNRDDFLAILVHEAGKTLPDAIAELREAVDFCRYYAAQGRKDFSPQGHVMPGYTGESNYLHLQGRGTFVCISPWNFPLAIFTGQVVAALVAGNCVIAKPASQTRLIAQRAVELMHKVGVPKDVLHLILAGGAYGGQIVAHKDVAGIAFTGSTATAKIIQKTLAQKDGPIVPLVAETGGQNAMIVDSSSLIEQAVDDIISSAFGSAGQRCSALRVLYVQEDIAESLLHVLTGAMRELTVGPPEELKTHIGPMIDVAAYETLDEHIAYLNKVGKLVCRAACTLGAPYFAPAVYEIPDINVLKGEVFGPILHVIRYGAKDLDQIIAQINTPGYGLTFGLHSRIQTRQKDIAAHVRAGNIYINRSMIGAVVGVQPFGGMGLSGTGPKAGGPYYLHAFATEKHISINTTAMGGNTSLVCLEET